MSFMECLFNPISEHSESKHNGSSKSDGLFSNLELLQGPTPSPINILLAIIPMRPLESGMQMTPKRLKTAQMSLISSREQQSKKI